MIRNTIILIDKDSKRKEKFIEKLKKNKVFSYTKIEALFQTINDMLDKKSNNFTKNQYLDFLNEFLNKLSQKQDLYLIDVDELSVQNANKLLEEHDNIIVIYLRKECSEGNIIQIDGSYDEELDKAIDYIVKGNIL